MDHRYLLTLEVAPLRVGHIYDELPSHLTLISRFLANRPVAEVVQPIFEQTAPIILIFGDTIKLGPKQVTAHIVHSPEEQKLHKVLHGVLSDVKVEFEYPDFVGSGHKPHVTACDGTWFNRGDEFMTSAAYLIEIVNKKRVVRDRFTLKGLAKAETL